MLKRKDLNMHTHIGRQCVGFDYIIDLSDKGMLRAEFSACDTIPNLQPKEWRMRIIFDRTRDADSQVYNFDYIMPRTGLPLELIAATGLRYFQLYIKEEVQFKSDLDFVLGNIVEGM